ncbi:class I SAM-dependent DNA methyltransferase [Pseudofrankia asymbiotica]|uniref:SAM-dependent methyltransferase n=1 Tax=Pseudofrankia asymbiotica TaxID=1834516 RepID=A0A1V2I5E1_9ACTN|nr:class I SAM-dependent methyltransferase [Pseudofrankia asymbiotica]ONH26382.1 SAM-dependent methyltransferase [Pseudofrankia asymbiotica]
MTQPVYLDATRAAYDAIASEYAALFADPLARRPLDRGLVTTFAELVRTGPPGPVADLGCGPGHLTAFLHSLGLDVFGADLSPAMISLARRAYPQLRFDVSTMTDLGLADGTLRGIVAWYSIIHAPPAALPDSFTEFHRLLAPGGQLLLAFQSTDQSDGPPQPFDHKVITAYRWPTDTAAALLRDAGLTETARLVRAPGDTDRFQQAFLLLRKPTSVE